MFSPVPVHSLSRVRLFATAWTAARQASLSITNSQSSLKLMSIELVMPSNHLILCCPLLLLPSIFLSIKVFSNESVLCIGWPKYWSLSYNISPSNEHSGLLSITSLLVELKKDYQSMVDSQCCVNFPMVGSYAFPLFGQSIYLSCLELLVLSNFSLPSHLFIYPVICLHKYRLMDICFLSVIYFPA